MTTHFNAIEFAPGVAGYEELVSGMTEIYGRMRRCHTLYEQHLFRYLPIDDVHNPSSVRLRIAELLSAKNAAPGDLVMFNIEFKGHVPPIIEWNLMDEDHRRQWQHHLRDRSAWETFKSRWLSGHDRRTFNAAAIDLFRTMLQTVEELGMEGCFYDVIPSTGWASSRDPMIYKQAEQRAKWADLCPRHTQSIYPRRSGDVMAAQNLRPVPGAPYRKLTLIQCPVYTNMPKADPLYGTPLSALDVAHTLAVADERGADLIWWLPVFTQKQASEALAALPAMREAVGT